MTIGLVSLGCAKNAVDLQVMSGHLLKAGHTLAPDPDNADVILVNTCAFIESAREEAAAEIARACELKRAGRCKAVVAAGCFVQRYRAEVLKAIPERAHVVLLAIDGAQRTSEGLSARLDSLALSGTGEVVFVIGGSCGVSADVSARANETLSFGRITLPLIRPIMMYVAVTSLIGGMQMFDLPFLMSNPASASYGSIQTVMMYLYKFGFTAGTIQTGYASAIAYALFLIILSVSVLQIKLFNRKE